MICYWLNGLCIFHITVMKKHLRHRTCIGRVGAISISNLSFKSKQTNYMQDKFESVCKKKQCNQRGWKHSKKILIHAMWSIIQWWRRCERLFDFVALLVSFPCASLFLFFSDRIRCISFDPLLHLITDYQITRNRFDSQLTMKSLPRMTKHPCFRQRSINLWLWQPTNDFVKKIVGRNNRKDPKNRNTRRRKGSKKEKRDAGKTYS